MNAQRLSRFILALVLYCAASNYASAEIVDDIRLVTDATGGVDAVIKFTVPIQRIRFFPQGKSQYLVVYFNILDNVPRDKWQDYESHRSPPSDVVVGFTVTTRDLNTGPKIEIQFNRLVEFSLLAGKDSRSLYIHIKPDNLHKDSDSKPVAGQAGGVITPPAMPLAAPAAAILPKLAPPVAATPSIALPGASGIATTPRAAAAPAPPVITTSAIPAPPVAQRTAPITLSPGQLGGKDGLPTFPAIEQTALVTGEMPPSGDISLADQIKRANSQAAVFMAKGHNALLAGNMFAAIEAFNSTLNLPSNKYTQDAQIWIGIAREKSGQPAKARLEYETYLKLYPEGAGAAWVKDRFAKLTAILPAPVAPKPVPVKAPARGLQTTVYGSLSMYYYHGASHTDTIATVGTVQTPSSLTVTDQSSLITNVSMTARSYNEEYDNRLVFQDFYAANFLPNQLNKNRLNAAYYELRNRVVDFSARFGRQSAMGGGVLGRFDGVAAGYGFVSNWRANVVAGRLSDFTIGSKPVFYGAGMDFGIKDPLGGSLYAINQKTGGITDRKAVGGNFRYFDAKKTAIAMLDYDMQFRDLNMVTVQGTLIGESGNDYNLIVDRRRTPSLSIRNAVNGTAASIDTLQQNGWTLDDLILLARQRSAISNSAQIGMTNHIRENLQLGTDFSVSNTSGMVASGTLNPDGTTGLEGFVAATPSTGNTWTVAERVIGNDLLSSRDVTMLSVSYTKSPLLVGKTVLLNNHAYIRELWTFDTTLRLYWQTDDLGGKQTIIAPNLKLGFRLGNSLTLETEAGLELTKATPSALQSSKTLRKYFTMGFRWDF